MKECIKFSKYLKYSAIFFALAGLISLSSGVQAAGSNVNGAIKGTVLDSNSSPVAGAKIVITNPKNGLSRSVTSDVNGNYSVNLPTGTYDITTSKEGSTGSNVRDVAVNIGSTSNIGLIVGTNGESIEEIIVTAKAIAASNDIASTGLNISIGDIELLPVARNIESIALLAPGTVSGDTAFGEDKNLVAFGGSSVAENVYYIDGLNVTNFRNGLGGSSVPFEFYEDFQIKTGGYSAEFGRSTGGVFNAVTKRGTNEWEYGIVSYYEPESLRSDTPNTLYGDGSLFDDNSNNERQTLVNDIYLGGPILKDKLFFYALYETSSTEEEFTSLDSIVGEQADRNFREIDDDFYGLNLFWNINDSHSLSLTHFTDERVRETETFNGYNVGQGSGGTSAGIGSEHRGGDNTVIRWDGQITDTFSMSALVGRNEYNLTDTNTLSDDCPNVVNFTDSLALPFIASCSGDFVNVTVGGDEREAIRLDAEWDLGDHLIRFGLDNEVNSSDNVENYAANGHYYAYFEGAAGARLPNGFVLSSDQVYVRDRVRTVGGSFETEANALYIEDIWTVTDSLTLSLGVRSESFDNKNPEGESFIKLDNQIAPRIGLEFDTSGGSGSSVFYANWGRYHLPIANNTNARLSGNESDRRTYHIFDGQLDARTNAPITVGPDGVPTTTQLGGVQVFADGSVPDVLELVDQTIDPMFQDEIILGYRMQYGDNWTLGIKYTNRELSSTIDDITVLDTGHYVLTNPGTDLVYFDDFNGDGVNERIELSAAELGYPEAARDFTSIELEADRSWDGKWGLNVSYTYSESEGNTEGLVKSDNGQDDAGITTDFDFPSLQDGSYGRLPNDREHQVKLRGNYQLTDKIVLGTTARYATGRPINRFGVGHPNSPPDYGATYYSLNAATGNYTFNPRGSAGETDSTLTVDVSAIYSMEFAGADVQFSVNVFNLFDSDKGVEVEERLERGAAGVPDNRYGLITSYQAPRRIRFGASVRF